MATAATNTIQIVVNGQGRQVPEGRTLAELLLFLEVDPARVAIELNGSILRRPEWESTMVAPETKLEIVQFVGGG